MDDQQPPSSQASYGDYSAVAGPGGYATVTVHQFRASQPPLQRPARAEHFTGREAELEQVLAGLQPGRVITLCGPGGIGKSALAAEAIWTLAPGDEPPEVFPDGIIFHSFYNQPEADLALEAIVRAFGEEPRPTARDAALRVLAGRTALLVMDGTENADDLRKVIDVRGNCGALVTSRHRKDVIDEKQNIEPLPLEKSLELLQAWGREQVLDEASARRICELVGGVPLAVRLAGRYMAQQSEQGSDYLQWLEGSPLEALDHGSRQHESVSVLLERSVGQVSEDAQQALSVVGCLALASFGAEVVATALEVSIDKAKRMLGELVNYGLLLRSEKRCQVSHSLIHTYARKREVPSAEVIRLVAAYYYALAREQGELGLAGYERLDAERPHIMAVLSRCVDQEEWEAALSLASAIEDYLDMQGHWTERLTAIKVGLTAARVLGDRGNESSFLNLLGLAYSDLGQVERAIEHYDQALAISREIGDRRGEGADLGNLGNAYSALGQVERAIEHYDQALVIAREIGDRRGEGNRLGNLGLAYSALGQVERAIEHYDQALAISRKIGDRRGEGADLSNLGNAYSTLGQVELAKSRLKQALVIFEEIKSPDAEKVRRRLDELDGK